MGKNKDISQDLCERIVELHNQGLGYRKISAQLCVPIASVGTIIRKWKCQNTTLSKPRTGRPRKINDCAAQKLVRTVVQRPQTTREELKDDLKASGIEASKHTISRALRREGLCSCTPRRTPLLQKRHVKARLKYANMGWQEVELPTSWGVLRGKSWGRGSKKILGVHGWLDNANTFDGILPLLECDCTFVSLDLPGHGKSDHFQNGFIYDPRSYVGSIKKAVEALGWKKFTYVGHSMGAVVGILYCSIFKDDIDCFISIDIIKPWSIKAADYASNMLKYFQSYFDNEKKCSLPPIVYSKQELISKVISGSRNSLDVAAASVLLERGAVSSKDGSGYLLTRDLRAKTYFVGFYSFEAWVAFAEAIACPILIIKAKDGHVYESSENYVVMRAAFERNCRLYRYLELPGTHHLHMLHPVPVAQAINAFLGDCTELAGPSHSELHQCVKKKDDDLVDRSDNSSSVEGNENHYCKNEAADEADDDDVDADDVARPSIANSDVLG
ncbi:Alpha/beta hydrolase fold-1 [Trinorchestia longiramus]|nr:Alpha/beta hydrolase fold-1 [Trinorchestia longiramus]